VVGWRGKRVNTLRLWSALPIDPIKLAAFNAGDHIGALRDANMKKLDTLEEFKAFFADENGGGFALMHWAGTMEEEENLAKENKITIRCIPLGDQYAEEGKCFLTGRPSSRRVVFARSY